MNRRKGIQTLILGVSASAVAFHGCKVENIDNEIPAEGETKYFG